MVKNGQNSVYVNIECPQSQMKNIIFWKIPELLKKSKNMQISEKFMKIDKKQLKIIESKHQDNQKTIKYKHQKSCDQKCSDCSL